MRRDDKQDKAHELYLKKRGNITPKEIAEQVGTTPEKVRKWKYRGKWAAELEKPRRGAPDGNQNAKGHGAPKENTNAETHGAYSRPRMERLTANQRAEVEALEAAFSPNALRHLKRLEAKRADLENRIAELQDRPEDTANLLDRTMSMNTGEKELLYQFRSTPFSRRMILEGELNRVDGRIQKLLDAIRGQEAEQRRFELEKERLEFQKQKAAGVFNFNDDGTIVPEDDETEIVEE